MLGTQTAPEAQEVIGVGDASPVSDLDFDRELLLSSGLFDEAHYVGQAGEASLADPPGHYLSEGWRAGVEPNAAFPGALLAPYFATLGFQGAPALTWLTLRSAGWPIPPTVAEVLWLAEIFRQSGVLDEAFYRSKWGLASAEIDPAIHYVAVGEHIGLAPSPRFDPTYYAERYPDVTAAGISCLHHYILHGRAEGRQGVPDWVCHAGGVTPDPAKDNIVLVVHETSRTGAPILGWNIALQLAHKYNLYIVRMGGGDLMREFADVCVELHGPAHGITRNQTDIKHALRALFDSTPFRYAIVNSAEGRHAVEVFVRRQIPALLLMHEFGAYVHPIASLRTALDWSTEVVFPSQVVARAAQQAHPIVQARSFHILAQGMSILPAANTDGHDQMPSEDLEKVTRLHDHEGAFIVLGAGTVHIRKGVDLFMAAAATVVRSCPHRIIHFLWVGHGYRPDEDMSYSVYIKEQLNRSGLQEHVTFLEAVDDLEPLYRIADSFFLSSRLDPMPNVSIDAAMRGIPVICFRDASGTAELMLQDPQTALGVVDHLDAEAAGKIIVELASDKSLHQRMSEATAILARGSFDMGKYVARLDAIGAAAWHQLQQRAADAKTLLSDNAFDADMFLGPSRVVETRQETVFRYLALAAARGWSDPPVPDTSLRRPSPGFNPRVFFQSQSLEPAADPLADFVRQGKPTGPWQAQVLRPDDPSDEPSSETSGSLTMALHAHFFYPELAGDFLARLQENQSSPDLFISTDSDQKAERLQRVLRAYSRGKVDVRVMPNMGRDIGPLLTGFADEWAAYDLIGHVHAKRSLFDGDGTMGDLWREFLWQNLLGGQWRMLDRIANAFQNQPDLGLVFPSDPHLIGWDANRRQAAELAARMGWNGDLPQHFDFPLGTMFWIRRQALQPLLNLALHWSDYPEEPLPYDGTILHALERLTPIANRVAGFQQAVTHIFGCSW